jgi:MATE family, multidrug efflux pump
MKNNNVLNGPIKKTLINMTIPMMYGIVAIMLFNIIDTIYVGQLGTKELAAMGFTFPVVFVIMSISMGIGMGTTSVISREIGKNNKKKVKRLTTDALMLALITVIFFAISGLLTIEPVFKFLGASPEIIQLIKHYMIPWYIGVGFLVIPMIGNSAIRATGDTKTPSKIMITAGIVNLILDPFLIFGIGPFPRLELMGAALATVISYVTTFSAALFVLTKREHMLQIPYVKTILNSWKQILYISIPASATNMLVPLSTGILTKMVSNYGIEAVAAFGVAVRLESLAMIGIMALSTALMPFIGQNYGAGNKDRILKSIKISNKYSMLWGIGIFILFVLIRKPIASIFNDDPEVIKIIGYFLLIVPLSYGLYGISLLVNVAFNATNKPLHSAMIISIRLLLFSIPLAYVGSKLFGINGIFLGISLANIMIGIIAYFWVKKFLFVKKSL